MYFSFYISIYILSLPLGKITEIIHLLKDSNAYYQLPVKDD